MGRVADAADGPHTTTSSPRLPPTAGAARAPPVPHEDAILVPRVRAGDGDGGGVARESRTHLLHDRGQRGRVRHPARLPQARRAHPGVPELPARQADAGDDVHGVVPDARPPGFVRRRLRVRAHGTHRDAARTQRAAHDPPHLLLLTPLLFPVQITYHWNISSKRLLYAGGHCHAPSCIDIRLFRNDSGTPQLLCRQESKYGQGDFVHDKWDEAGYITLPPCLWGDDEGLDAAPWLPDDTPVFSIKRNRNTHLGHFGEMASWQMRGVDFPHP